MNKNVLFLEDNLGGIGSIILSLRHENVHCTITSDLNAWRAALVKFKQTKIKLDLLIMDDNIYKETTLDKIERPDIGTNGGTITGSKIATLLRSSDAPAFLNDYKDIPIIIYSVHDPKTVKANIGNLSNVYVYEKLRGKEHEAKILEKAKELLGA